MYRLSESEVDALYERLQASEIRNGALAQELLDHVCCCVESAMAEGLDFETACSAAIAAVCPNGCREIENELLFLFTFNKHVNMKRSLFSAGFITAFLFSFGFLFKLMHWPGATVMLLCGSVALLISLGLLTFYTLMTQSGSPFIYKLRMFAGLASGLLIAAGSTFKILHLPYASILLVCGVVLLNILFLPLFFYQLYRKSLA